MPGTNTAGKTTCGPTFVRARDLLIPDTIADDPIRRAFAKGMLVGQAEKVALGAASACMIRPITGFGYMHIASLIIAEVYNLLPRVYIYESWGSEQKEIWLLKDREILNIYVTLKNTEPDTPQWHILRAFICGIPSKEVDILFHERRSTENSMGTN